MARKYTKRPVETQLNLDSGCTALYIRVSTEKQADEGFSLDAQRAQLTKYCEALGWNVCPDHVYVDAGISGKSSDRAGLQQMMAAAKSGAIVRIVTAKLDRLARNVREFLIMADQLVKWGCTLVLIKESFDTSTPQGKFALTMFAAMAELEASTITERVLTGKRQKAQEGGYNGARCPIGYSYDGGIFTTTDQATTVKRIFGMFNDGHSLNGIARQLNKEGVLTATGKVGKWTPYGISHILRNGFYAGLAEWDGVRGVEGEQPTIISREEYEAAQMKLSTTKRGQRVDLATA